MDNFKVIRNIGDDEIVVKEFDTYQEAYEYVANYDGAFKLDIEYNGEYGYDVEKQWKCHECGEFLTIDSDYQEHEGDTYCSDCFHERFITCEDCGAIVDSDSSTYINGYDKYICQSCLDDDYNTCESCGEWIHRDDTYYSDDRNGGESYCESCYNDRFSNCECCDREYYYDDGYDGRCPDCNRRSDLLDGYHSMKDNDNYTYYSTPEEVKSAEEKGKDVGDLLYYGFELEVDDGHNMDDALRDVDTILNSDNHLVNFEEDGSLSDDGFEIISQPMTLDFMRSKEQDLSKALKSLIDNGYTSHNNGGCGLHIHFSRNYFNKNGEYDNSVDSKLVLLSEVFKKELQVFCRRGSGSYVRFLSDCHGNSIKTIKDAKSTRKDDTRYYVFNFQNSHTVEFRLARGTLRFETFMATIELLDNIIHFAQKKEGNLLGLTWRELVSYNKRSNKYLYNHCKALGLIDTTSVINFATLDLQPNMRDLNKIMKKNKSIAVDFMNGGVDANNISDNSRTMEEV